MIGFLAKKGCGKSTASRYLAKKYGYVEFSFADPLKKGLQHWFGFSNKQLYEEKGKEEIDPYWGVSPRQVMQYVGTDIVRDKIGSELLKGVGNDFWIKRMDKQLGENPGKVVISDVRFQNEVDYILSKGGCVVKIERFNKGEEDRHISEKGIDSVVGHTIIIHNSGTLEDFYSRLDDLATIAYL